MTRKQVTLAVASFLDSPHARSVPGVREDEVRRIAELFLRACYERVGARPELLDGEGLRDALAEALPGEFHRKDGVHERVPDVIGAYFDHLDEVATVPHLFEIRVALEASAGPFRDAVARGDHPRRLAPPEQPAVVHHAPKLGRNDPCFCGSGKKFKKCHGKGRDHSGG